MDITNTTLTRRKLLASAGTTGMALFTGTAAGDDSEMPAPNTTTAPCQQLGPDANPPFEAVDTEEKALAYIEGKINAYTNRPTNSYVDNGDPQLAYDTGETSEGALRSQIRVAAMALARAINSGAPIPRGVQFRVYRAVIGEPYEYVASYYLGRGKAMDFTGGAMRNGSIGCDEYLSWAYNQLTWR